MGLSQNMGHHDGKSAGIAEKGMRDGCEADDRFIE